MPYEYEFDPKDTKDIIREYKEGFSLRDIAEAFAVSPLVISNLLRSQGVTIRGRGARSYNLV